MNFFEAQDQARRTSRWLVVMYFVATALIVIGVAVFYLVEPGHYGFWTSTIGGLLLAAGYFSLGIRSMPTFYAGLALLCFGNGLLKPNISAMVGNLYEPGDPKRDAGFNIFYMGINIGSFTATLLCGWLGETYDWSYGFGAAGIGISPVRLRGSVSGPAPGTSTRRPSSAACRYGTSCRARNQALGRSLSPCR